MNYETEEIYRLLPAVYRLRDHEEGGPLKALIAVLTEQAAIVQEGIEQAYDDLFIETCAEWVVPYIGDLIGARLLGEAGADATTFSRRAQVANTLAMRRRKGTLAMLEQLARDTTNYPAVAVEFFKLLATTQYMNHTRPELAGTVDVRRRDALERVDTPFDRLAHTFEARRIVRGRGRYNIPNVGLFLFRLKSLPLTQANAVRFDAADDFRYLFNPLGIDMPLFNEPQTETTLTQLAEPANVPGRISRLDMEADKGRFYGADASIFLRVAGNDIPAADVIVCNLSDRGDGTNAWAHTRVDKYSIDPALGRLALPTGAPAPAPDEVLVSFRYGFSDEIGGGEYERPDPEPVADTQQVAGGAGLQTALNAVLDGGFIQIGDSRTYPLNSAAPNLHVAANRRVELRATNGARPVIDMDGGSFIIEGDDGAEVVLNGLVVVGGALHVIGGLKSLTLTDCTLVPGVRRDRLNEPVQPDAPSLIVEAGGVNVVLLRCITGGIRVANTSKADFARSIIDATSDHRLAYAAAPDESLPGGELTITNCTVVGRVQTQAIHAAGDGKASNCIFVAREAVAGESPVRAARTQTGCVRFCFLPRSSRVPRRYQCHPASAEEATRVRPVFTSLRFGTPGYCQLRQSCPPEIGRGADDESEMGVFHDLHQPQREANLRVRLEEYLRFGLEAGIIYAD
jgi:hypothetical protein